jgi:hypothetical protein
MLETIELNGTMPPEGSPSQYRTRFPVHITAQGSDISPGWSAIARYSSPDPAYVGAIPDNLLIGYTSEEYYSFFSEIYRELLDNLGFTPSPK